MRLVFFGSGHFAVPALQALAPSVTLVVTQPDRPSGRGMKLRSSPVKLAATSLWLRVVEPERARAPDFIEVVRKESPDALVVASYGQILSQSLLDVAPFGGINLHGSLLPKYRGAAPIQRAILEGETETGVTVMQMDKGMDTGDIIAMRSLSISPDETASELEGRLATLAGEMAFEWLPKIVASQVKPTPQDHESATMAPKVGKGEAELKATRDAAGEYNRFRAFTPNPGAYLKTRFGGLAVRSARHSSTTGEPGRVVQSSPSCIIAFENGSIELLEVAPEGKRLMSGRDYANGMRLKTGDLLVEP